MALKDLLNNGVVLGTGIVAVATVVALATGRQGSFDHDDHDEDEDDFDLQAEMQSGIKIQEKGGGVEAWFSGKRIAKEKSMKTLLLRIRLWMKAEFYWPNVFYVNDHGNVNLVNVNTGQFVRGWV